MLYKHCVLGGDGRRPYLAAETGRRSLDLDQVLDGNGYAVQGAAVGADTQLCRCLLRLRKRAIVETMGHGIERRLQRIHPLQAQANHVHRRE